MSCAQRLLHNGLNHARTAALVASSVLPVEHTVRTLPALRSGSAGLTLAGAYSGAADATFDVEIVDATPTTPILSKPLLAGVGNGALSALSFTGPAQNITLELVDAGLPTLYAAVAFAGTQITARAAGAAGNGIAITVDASGLTFTPLAYSLVAPLPKDTRRSDAVGLDFAAAVMAADNQFPASAKRIVFAADKSRIYRQAKQWTGTKWEYVFEPAIQSYRPAGDRISQVTGTYSVTVAQGATTEVFTGITSNYDLLIKLNTLSALVRIDGVIANDHGIDGQAAGDLTMRTDAYLLSVNGNGSSYAQNIALQNVTIGSAAPTEIIELRCWATTARDSTNAHLGAELWTVKGSVSGDQGNFKTGDLITVGASSFIIPTQYPIGYGNTHGNFTVRNIQYVSRAAPAVPPPICVVGMALGPDAIDQTLTLVYTKRPSSDCACDDLSVPDLSNSECLMGANNPNAPGATSVSYPSTITTRMANLWDWRADVAESYSTDHLLTAGSLPDREKERVDKSTIIATLLEKTAIAVNATPAALTLWDTMFTDLQAQYTTPGAPPAPTAKVLKAVEAIAVGQVVAVSPQLDMRLAARADSEIIAPLFLGLATVAVAAGATTPASTVAISGNRITGLTGLTPDASYKLGITPGTLTTPATSSPSGETDRVAKAITSTLAAPAPLSPNYYQWIDNRNPLFFNGVVVVGAAASEEFNVIIERFQTRCDAILASAGISPLGKSDASIVSDDGCWQDLTSEAYYWAVDGSARGAYLPAFNNTPYYSSRNVAGHITASFEYAYQINVKCPEKLREGDTITLAIGNAGWPATYQVGDAINLSVISAAAQTLAGGQNGNSDQKWNVNGSLHGAYAPFTATGGSGAYADSGLAFTITSGGIKFAKGDRFAFSAEGGHWRWRKNGGSWSAALDITTAATALSDGVSGTFAPGVAPSFTASDLYSFAVRQPHAPGNVQTPSPFAWRWTGASATLDIDMGSARAFDAITLARHQLPLTATVTLTAGSTQGATDVLAATVLAMHAGTLAKLWDAPLSARWVRISLSGATAGAIGWVTVCEAFRTSLAAELTVRRDYVMDRGNGINPAARNLGKGKSGSINWDSLEESDADGIADAIDWLKSHDDEPLQFFSAPTRETESIIAQIDSDSIEFKDAAYGQAAAGVPHRQSVTLGLKAVIQ